MTTLTKRLSRPAIGLLLGFGLLATHPIPAKAAGHHWIAYAADVAGNRVFPVDTSNNTVGPAITGSFAQPVFIAITPDATRAFVTDFGATYVTPIDTATNTALSPITVPGRSYGVAVAPDGTTAYVTLWDTNKVVPIDIASGTVGAAIAVGNRPWSIGITPNGTKAYVTNGGSNTVSVIDLVTKTVTATVSVAGDPNAIRITPNGGTAYVADLANNTVTPIDTATDTALPQIPTVNGAPEIGMLPDGTAAYAMLTSVQKVQAIDTATNTAGAAISAPAAEPWGTASFPDGSRSYVTYQSGAMSTLDLGTGTFGAPFATGLNMVGIAITPDQAPQAQFTVTLAAAGAATSFDASKSTVQFGTIANYSWNFGDGVTVATTTPVVSHVYARAGAYTVTLTETSSAGTSTRRVFTGQTLSRNGSEAAVATQTLTVSGVPVPQTGATPGNSADPFIGLLLVAVGVGTIVGLRRSRILAPKSR
jgi:YVTN family beta-propeller protein